MSDIKYLSSPELSPPLGQYSQCVKVPASATTLYVAGQLGVQKSGDMADGFANQLRQTFSNLRTVLQSAGMEMQDLVQLTYYLVDASDLDTLREIRRDYLPKPPPASTVLIVKALARRDWLVEIDGIAAK